MASKTVIRPIAKNLSTLRATTPTNDAPENRPMVKSNVVHVASAELSRCNHLTSRPMKKGWTSKPTPRSETARLRSNVFRVFGIDEAFVNAWIVTLLKMMAVIVKKALKTPLTMYHDLNPYSWPDRAALIPHKQEFSS